MKVVLKFLNLCTIYRAWSYNKNYDIVHFKGDSNFVGKVDPETGSIVDHSYRDRAGWAKEVCYGSFWGKFPHDNKQKDNVVFEIYFNTDQKSLDHGSNNYCHLSPDQIIDFVSTLAYIADSKFELIPYSQIRDHDKFGLTVNMISNANGLMNANKMNGYIIRMHMKDKPTLFWKTITSMVRSLWEYPQTAYLNLAYKLVEIKHLNLDIMQALSLLYTYDPKNIGHGFANIRSDQVASLMSIDDVKKMLLGCTCKNVETVFDNHIIKRNDMSVVSCNRNTDSIYLKENGSLNADVAKKMYDKVGIPEHGLIYDYKPENEFLIPVINLLKLMRKK